MRWLATVFSVSLTAFVLGFVAEGFWGGTDGETTWVDQTFGFAMYLGAVLAVVFGLVLVASLLIGGTLRAASRGQHPQAGAADTPKGG